MKVSSPEEPGFIVTHEKIHILIFQMEIYKQRAETKEMKMQNTEQCI